MRGFGLIAAVLLASAPGFSRAEVTASSDLGFVVRHSAEVAVPPGPAWDVLVVPAEWWNGAHTYSADAANLSLDPRAGGCFCEALPPKPDAVDPRPGSVEHMRVIHVAAGRVLRLRGGLGPLQSEAAEGTLTVTLKPIEGGTRVLFEYAVGGYMRYKTAELAPAVDRVVGEQLTRLAAKLGPLAKPGPDKPAIVEPGR